VESLKICEKFPLLLPSYENSPLIKYLRRNSKFLNSLSHEQPQSNDVYKIPVQVCFNNPGVVKLIIGSNRKMFYCDFEVVFYTLKALKRDRTALTAALIVLENNINLFLDSMTGDLTSWLDLLDLQNTLMEALELDGVKPSEITDVDKRKI